MSGNDLLSTEIYSKTEGKIEYGYTLRKYKKIGWSWAVSVIIEGKEKNATYNYTATRLGALLAARSQIRKFIRA